MQKNLFLFSTIQIFLVFVERMFLGVHCAETGDLHSAYRAPTRRERQQSALGLWRSFGARALSLHSAPPFISRETHKSGLTRRALCLRTTGLAAEPKAPPTFQNTLSAARQHGGGGVDLCKVVSLKTLRKC